MSELLNKFYEEYGIKPFELPEDKVLIDPGVKSTKSLESKVHRYVDNFGVEDYRLREVSDISRCTVLVESYSQVPSIIKKIKEYSSNAVGYISECPNGYKGIHLNFTKDGIATEIQICTADVFKTGQATEVIYQKWREFNFREELAKIRSEENALMKEGKLDKASKEDIRQKKLQLRAKIKEYKYDYDNCNKVYNDALNRAHFNESRKVIEAQLHVMTFEQKGKSKWDNCPERLSKVLDVDLKNGGENIDDNILRQTCEEFHELAKETHSKTMAQLENYVQASMDNEYEPTNLEKNINKLTQFYDYNIIKTIDKETYVGNINYISRDKSKFIADVLESSKMHNFDEISPQVKIQEYYSILVLSSTLV